MCHMTHTYAYTYVRHDSFTGAFVIGIYIALLALVSAICIRVHTSRKRAREHLDIHGTH